MDHRRGGEGVGDTHALIFSYICRFSPFLGVPILFGVFRKMNIFGI